MSYAYTLTRPTHYALGESYSSPCGYHGMQHRALGYTRDVSRVSCRKCLSWIRKQPKNVTP